MRFELESIENSVFFFLNNQFSLDFLRFPDPVPDPVVSVLSLEEARTDEAVDVRLSVLMLCRFALLLAVVAALFLSVLVIECSEDAGPSGDPGDWGIGDDEEVTSSRCRCREAQSFF